VQLGIFAGVAAIVLVVALFMWLGGSGSPSATSVTNPPVNAVPLPTPSVSPTPQEIPVFSGRDPFQNLFQPATSGSNSPTPSPTHSTNNGATTPPPGGGNGTPPSSGGGNNNPGGNSGSGTTIGGHTVLLDDVFVTNGVRKAQVEVDGTVYTVAAGQSFDDNFKLVSFPSASCAHFVFGDESFTLCTAGGK
jgi:hypothetical protein